MTPWLVVPCPGSRAEELLRCLGSLGRITYADDVATVIVTSAHHDPLWAGGQRPGLPLEFGRGPVRVCDHEDFSLPHLWNVGLDHAYERGATEVAVFASDVVGHPGSIASLAAALRNTGAVMAGPALDGSPTRILDGPRTHHDRVPGACFMLAAEHRLRCDETYRWWYGDDDLEMQARQVGPVALFDGTGLELSQPDAGLDTPEKQRWAVEDRQRFVDRWGCEPW